MGAAIQVFSKLWTLISGSRFFWALLKNYGVLKENLRVIGEIITKVMQEGRKTPDCDETNRLLKAVSNILKTEVIDLPEIDEYQLAIKIDEINANLVCELKDTKSDKTFKVGL